jgi:hypothetical protein
LLEEILVCSNWDYCLVVAPPAGHFLVEPPAGHFLVEPPAEHCLVALPAGHFLVEPPAEYFLVAPPAGRFLQLVAPPAGFVPESGAAELLELVDNLLVDSWVVGEAAADNGLVGGGDVDNWAAEELVGNLLVDGVDSWVGCVADRPHSCSNRVGAPETRSK